MKRVRAKDKSKVMDDLKPLYKAGTTEKAEELLTSFIEKHNVIYPKVAKILKDNESLLTFYRFPSHIRCSIYTINLIEAFNKNLKKGIKRKEPFPNKNSLERYVCSYCSDYNHRFNTRIHKGFAKASTELNELFD